MCRSKKSVKIVSTENDNVEDVEDKIDELFMDLINIDTIDAKKDWV